MRRRRYLAALLASSLAGGALAAVTTAGAEAAIRRDCGGRSAELVAKSGSAVIVVRATDQGDLYGGDHKFSACYGKHGRTRALLDFGSPYYPMVGLSAFKNQYAALEVTVDDQTCGKYFQGPCPTARYLSAWNTRTGRQVSHAAPEGLLGDLVVSPRGALAWTEPAVAPEVGMRVRAVFGELGSTTLATTTSAVTGLKITRTEVRWTDAAGRHAAPVPARSVLP